MSYAIKHAISIALVCALTACASVDVSTLSLSKATVSQMKVNEAFHPERGRHHFDITFDYAIEEFHPERGIYSCSIQFALNTPGQSVAFGSPDKMKCPLTKASGRIHHTASGPLDRSSSTTPKKYLDQMTFPVQYKIVILQKTGTLQRKIIGESEFLTSKVDEQMLLDSSK